MEKKAEETKEQGAHKAEGEGRHDPAKAREMAEAAKAKMADLKAHFDKDGKPVLSEEQRQALEAAKAKLAKKSDDNA